MRNATRSLAVAAVLMLSVTTAFARSQHAAPTVTKCSGGCRVKLPILNQDGYKVVHAWAVPVNAGQASKANVMNVPGGVPGGQYLGTLNMSGQGNFELEATIKADGQHFTAGSQLRIFTGYHNNPGEGPHLWGGSMPTFAMEVGP